MPTPNAAAPRIMSRRETLPCDIRSMNFSLFMILSLLPR
jgi:hypothetical protein